MKSDLLEAAIHAKYCWERRERGAQRTNSSTGDAEEVLGSLPSNPMSFLLTT